MPHADTGRVQKGRKKLTAASLTSLKPGDYTDTVLPGLTLRVGVKRRTWQLRHRWGGAERRDIVGHYPQMGLAQAREAARALALRIDQGAAPEPAPVHPRAALTLATLIDRYEAQRIAEGHRTKSLAEAMRALRVGLADYLHLPAHLFGKGELRAARDKITERGAIIAGNRLLSYLGPVMRWAAQEDLVATNFVRDLRRAPERKRQRTLTTAELLKVWRAAGALDGYSAPAFGRLVRFLIVTGQRRDEAASLKHGAILDGTWRMQDNKASRPQVLKLPALALAQMGQGTANDLAFPGEGGAKLGGWSKLKVRLDKLARIDDWRLHDLRRTAATGMQELGISQDIIGGVLNHSIAGVGGVYLRAEMEKAKADALARWAAHLERLIAADAA